MSSQVSGEHRATLGVLRGAVFNSTADQQIKINFSKYIIRRITVVNPSGSLSGAIGGLYTAASKGGTNIVAATQVYSAITGLTKWLDLTLAAILGSDVRTESTLFFSLTTALGASRQQTFSSLGTIFPKSR